MNTGSRFAFALAAALVLVACGGGSGGGKSAVGVSPPPASPVPAPTASSTAYQVHSIVELDGSISLEGFAGAAPLTPPGVTLGPAIAGAVITYPDGSQQVADQQGNFVPSQSAYGVAFHAQLELNAGAQPMVVLSDPAGAARARAMVVSAYRANSVAAGFFARVPAGAYRARAADATINLAGVSTLPAFVPLFSGERAALNVEGLDDSGRVTSLQNAAIRWRAQSGSLVQVPGTNQVFYTAPAGSGADVITATVSLPASSVTFSASSNVAVYDRASAVAVSGRLIGIGGAPIAGAAALFLQTDQPALAESVFWTSLGSAQGAYRRTLPANGIFATGIGLPAAASPSGAFSYFVAGLGGTTGITTGAPGTSTALDLAPAPPATIFTNALDQVQSATPPIISLVRDAWGATGIASSHNAYDADSGVLPILIAVPATLPSPARPAAIAEGQFAGWCYQWIAQGAAAALIVIANADANCTMPGNTAYAITPVASATYAYVRYSLAHPYALASPLNAAPPDALLAEAGTWMQNVQFSGGTISSDAISASAEAYDDGHQTLGSPAYRERAQYNYALGSNGLATVTILSDAIGDPLSGLPVSDFSGTQVQLAPLTGTGSCAGTAVACYSVSGMLTRHFFVSDGAFDRSFAVAQRINGDGSAQYTYQSTGGFDRSKVVLPIAAYDAQSGGNCAVCAAQLAGVYDIDGQTQLGSFTVAADGSVDLKLLGSIRGGPPGPVIGSLHFIL